MTIISYKLCAKKQDRGAQRTPVQALFLIEDELAIFHGIDHNDAVGLDVLGQDDLGELVHDVLERVVAQIRQQVHSVAGELDLDIAL